MATDGNICFVSCVSLLAEFLTHFLFFDTQFGADENRNCIQLHEAALQFGKLLKKGDRIFLHGLKDAMMPLFYAVAFRLDRALTAGVDDADASARLPHAMQEVRAKFTPGEMEIPKEYFQVLKNWETQLFSSV